MGSLVGSVEPANSGDHGLGGTVLEMGKDATRHHAENNLELQELVGGWQATAVFEAGDLAVTAVPQKCREITLGQTRSAS